MKLLMSRIEQTSSSSFFSALPSLSDNICHTEKYSPIRTDHHTSLLRLCLIPAGSCPSPANTSNRITSRHPKDLLLTSVECYSSDQHSEHSTEISFSHPAERHGYTNRPSSRTAGLTNICGCSFLLTAIQPRSVASFHADNISSFSVADPTAFAWLVQ